MSRYHLVEPTDQILNLVANPILPEELSSPEIQRLIDQLFEIAAGKGLTKEDSRQVVGLAGPQVGIGKRIIVMDLTATGAKQKQSLQELINPEITQRSTETSFGREGCWSCDNICGKVERAQTITLTGTNRSGLRLTLNLTGFPARIAQHEVDHLDGIRFPDRIPADRPECLHLVQPAEFEAYRAQWATWPKLCPRERWESLKSGLQPS